VSHTKQNEKLSKEKDAGVSNKEGSSQTLSHHQQENNQGTPKVKCKSGGFAKFLLSVLLVLLMAGLFYAVLQLKSVQQKVAVSDSHNHDQFDQFKEKVTQLTQNAKENEKMWEQERESNRLLEAKVKRMEQKLSNTSEDWSLIELGDMLRMANLKLKVDKNPQVALVLLSQVNEKLGELMSENLTALKSSLLDDIVKLRTVPKIDMNLILPRLSAISKQIMKLPLKQAKFTAVDSLDSDQVKAIDPEENLSWFKKSMKTTLSQLQKIVIIRRNTKPIVPLLSPESAFVVEQNIQLQIQQAQWALIQKEGALYQKSLADISKTVEKYFNSNVSATQSLLQEIKMLSDVKIAKDLPSLDNTIKVFNERLKETTVSSQTILPKPINQVAVNDNHTYLALETKK